MKLHFPEDEPTTGRLTAGLWLMEIGGIAVLATLFWLLLKL